MRRIGTTRRAPKPLERPTVEMQGRYAPGGTLPNSKAHYDSEAVMELKEYNDAILEQLKNIENAVNSGLERLGDRIIGELGPRLLAATYAHEKDARATTGSLRSRSMNGGDGAEKVDEDNAPQPVQPVKRRGRPKKTDVTPPSAKTPKSPAPKKRGRPPNSPAQVAPPKKRGRKPTTPVHHTIEDDEQDGSSDQDDDGQDGSSDQDDADDAPSDMIPKSPTQKATPVKKSTGRPKKTVKQKATPARRGRPPGSKNKNTATQEKKKPVKKPSKTKGILTTMSPDAPVRKRVKYGLVSAPRSPVPPSLNRYIKPANW